MFIELYFCYFHLTFNKMFIHLESENIEINVTFKLTFNPKLLHYIKAFPLKTRPQVSIVLKRYFKFWLKLRIRSKLSMSIDSKL